MHVIFMNDDRMLYSYSSDQLRASGINQLILVNFIRHNKMSITPSLVKQSWH